MRDTCCVSVKMVISYTGTRSVVVSAFKSHQSCGDVSALAGSYPDMGVLWAQWEGCNHTAEIHPLHGCVFKGVDLIT